MKAKSLSEDRDDEKKENKQATTRTNKQIQIKPKENKNNTNTDIEQGQSSKIFCGICLTNSNMFSTGLCNHPFCTISISKYAKIQIKEKVVKVKCPDPECSVELKQEHLQSILPNEIIVDWESANCEASIALKEKIYCPYKNCSLLLVNDEAGAVTSCECPSCHRLFCAQCKVPWHANMNCQEFQNSEIGQGLKQSDRKFLELAKREKWKRCPKCSMHVQRTTGCVAVTSATCVAGIGIGIILAIKIQGTMNT
ncbi:probable E3 ubiquitin-protein ligase RNF217 [Medicago truncatula]|uniref:RBR-type E3 ubiquitin transferase n=1 Tax=Medicago truncatula TaxID=3880 RepID=A0A072UYG9_MEDTR|nr:probable E3 ubiquitin-protein ligase RNF217 [Medicago truncatula]KEH34168.1 IBR domain protein [Medicago truncatula]